MKPHTTTLLPTARNVTIIRSTKNMTDYRDQDHRVVNHGVDVRRIEQATGRRVPQLHVVDSGAKTRTDVGRSELRIFRPQQKQLESVRAGPRTDAGKPAGPPARSPDTSRPKAGRRDAPELVVAPRRGQARTDSQQLEKQERREQQELEQYQMKEKRTLEKIHQQEIAGARAQAERSRVEKAHQVESEALVEQQRNAEQQLAVRQRAKRQAVQADPPGRTTTPRGEQRPADRQRDKDKKDKKK